MNSELRQEREELDIALAQVTKFDEKALFGDFAKLRTVPTIVIAHTFCASPDTRISYRQCLLIQGYFCAV